MLRPGFFLPPLMFSAEELEALDLGARWVEAQPDSGLAAAARNALGKIATASPEDLRDKLRNTGLWHVPSHFHDGRMEPLLGVLRAAMREETVLRISYADEAGRTSERAIWPVALAYYEGKQIVAAWCTMREDFRNFRIDRIIAADPVAGRFGKRRAVLAREWEDQWRAAARARMAGGSDS